MQNKNNLFAYYYKSASIIKIVRYTVTFLLIIFLLACIFAFRKDITAENIQLFAKYISLNEGNRSEFTDEFSISATDDSQIFIISDNVAVVKKNNLSLYDLGGQKLFSFDYSFSTPSYTSDDRNLLVYDIGGKSLSIFNTFSKIKTIDFTHNVTFADISSKGVTAVSNEDSYRSVLSVFNSDFNKFYTWYSSEKYITSAKLSHNGRYVLATVTCSKDAGYSSSAILLDTNSNKAVPAFVADMNDELPVYSGYSNDGNSIFIITDSNIHFYNSELTHTKTYKFNQSKIESYYTDNDMIIITERNNISGNSMLITGLSSSGNHLFSFNVFDEISDMCIGKNKFFALGKKAVYEYSKAEYGYSLTNIQNLNNKYNSIICDSRDTCYITNNIRVQKILFNSKKDL